jgi:adenosine deaminase
VAYGFTFEAWKCVDFENDFQGTVAKFTKVANELAEKLTPLNIFPCNNINFYCIDVGNSWKDWNKREILINKIQNSLLLNVVIDCFDFTPNDRLLFIGEEASLAGQSEADKAIGLSGAMRPIQIKKDLEFWIRALQKYKIAHYGSIGELGTARPLSAQTEYLKPTQDEMIMSAILGLTRYYKNEINSKINAKKQIEILRTDIKDILESARKLKGFNFLGLKEERHKKKSVAREDLLLNEVRLLFQLGKRTTFENVEGSTLRELDELPETQSTFHMPNVPRSSYQLVDFISRELNKWTQLYHKKETGEHFDKHQFNEISETISGSFFALRRYETLRDIGRLIGSASVMRLQTLFKDKNNPKILIIDSLFYNALSQSADRDGGDPEIEGLRVALELVGLPLCRAHVVPTSYLPSDAAPFSAARDFDICDPNADAVTLERRHSVRSVKAARPEAYRIILIDPEATFDHLGPVRVMRLANYLRHLDLPRPKARPNLETRLQKRTPEIIAFSQRESAGYVQQCLNFGASAYSTKDRPFFLLFDMNRVIDRKSKKIRNDTGMASQFRIMSSLKPHVLDKLQQYDGPAYIYGGQDLGNGDVIIDRREEAWISRLPKADLHYHIGTSISFPTINALAFNTFGYWCTENDTDNACQNVNADHPTGLFKIIAQIVLVCEGLRIKIREDKKTLPLVACLAAAAAGVLARPEFPDKPFGLGDSVIDALAQSAGQFRSFEITALLVALLAPPDTSAELLHQEYFLSLGTNFGNKIDQTTPIFDPKAAFMHARDRTSLHLRRISSRWNGLHTNHLVWEGLGRERDDQKYWENLNNALFRRITAAKKKVSSLQNKAQDWKSSEENWGQDFQSVWSRSIQWLKEKKNIQLNDTVPDAEPVCGIEPYVVVSSKNSGTDGRSGLQHYLQGADFLGSAHLQYPENLLMAAYDITRCNAKENIIYSEVRCETTGYTLAGMSAEDATETLRHGFNLASLFLAIPREANAVTQPLVRTNILLAAKRHKTEPEARRIVALLDSYLEKRAGIADDGYSRQEYDQAFPSWWRPCDVVGFDISGDESKSPDWLEGVIKPLAARSSPITIHAGEAESAQSIWRAVYEFNATRIGHGLRLAEDIALLGYFVREGICVEFCPNSNTFTNRFSSVSDPNSDRKPLPRHTYPLLEYMKRGIEVAISTDNRFLHPSEKRSLTSEYLGAARLVGGLTRSEVLQIVKAGFKNAFLGKDDISEMLAAVEEIIYSMITVD